MNKKEKNKEEMYLEILIEISHLIDKINYVSKPVQVEY